MKKNTHVTPFLKWVGGKRQLIPAIDKLLPKRYSTYHEPFVGGGAILFHLQPPKAVINDFNRELINTYRVIKNNPDELINDLKTHVNTPDYFYEIRALDRSPGYQQLSSIKKASRLLYLNKTCYNGLYRVNSAGEFNSPFGKYKNPNIPNEEAIRAVSDYLNSNDITILNEDFELAVKNIGQDDFVYFDPPYDPVSKSANFTGYVQEGFDIQEQLRLRKLCDKLDAMGVKFMVSNSATPYIMDVYSNYKIKVVKANRAINSNGAKRGEVNEILIRNYG